MSKLGQGRRLLAGQAGRRGSEEWRERVGRPAVASARAGLKGKEEAMLGRIGEGEEGGREGQLGCVTWKGKRRPVGLAGKKREVGPTDREGRWFRPNDLEDSFPIFAKTKGEEKQVKERKECLLLLLRNFGDGIYKKS